MTITIRPVTTIEECRSIEGLQKEIWQTEPIDVVPDHVTITIAKNGGVVLLARDEGQPVGFCFSFQGETEDGLRKHASHQAGVLPAWQSKGVGYQLKLAQREAVLAQGIDLITWTFDPLISRNAYLNIGKLGGISQTYDPRHYGQMRDGLNAGLESDRLLVDWRLTSSHVKNKLAAAKPITIDAGSVLNPATTNRQGSPVPPDRAGSLSGPTHFVQIPGDMPSLKQQDLPLAMAWQQQIRGLMQSAFAAGYMIADFVWQREQNAGFYLLTKETDYYEN